VRRNDRTTSFDSVFDIFLGIAVVLLHVAFHLLGGALDLLLRAVENFARFLLNLASNFFRSALDLIGIHINSYRHFM
jgi:hypothetical protein